MDKIQLIFFFVNGFLISRLIIKAELPSRFVYFLFYKRHLSINRVIFYVVCLSALLSIFIPNVITVLTLLPLLEVLRNTLLEQEADHNDIPTLLALSAIYGSNIGGMGSIIGTPANGFLVTYAEIDNFSGVENLTFASWFIWAIPLVIVLIFVSWLLLIGFFRPQKYVPKAISVSINAEGFNTAFQKMTVILSLVYFISSLIFSVAMTELESNQLIILFLSGGFSIAFALYLFFFPVSWKDGEKTKLLFLKDCYSNLPLKGFYFVGIAVVVSSLLWLSNLNDSISALIAAFLPEQASLLLVLIVVALFTTFATEIVSNTAIQISLFVILAPFASEIGMSPLLILLVVTLSSTCAFMSPIATGVNGLAFGGIKGVSFKKMLAAGFLMNIGAALLISLWIRYVVKWYWGV